MMKSGKVAPVVVNVVPPSPAPCAYRATALSTNAPISLTIREDGNKLPARKSRCAKKIIPEPKACAELPLLGPLPSFDPKPGVLRVTPENPGSENPGHFLAAIEARS